MIRNMTIRNLTGREIPFDLAQVLESAPHFNQITPNTWEKPYAATVCVTDTVLVEPYNFRPGITSSPEKLKRFAVKDSMKLLSIEASYLYRCHALLEWNMEDQQLNVCLRSSAGGRRSVRLGSYFQKSNDKEPVQWLVLEEKNGEALLLSELALHTGGYWRGNPWEAYQDNGKRLVWENSDFRKWLNGEFCDTVFSREEQHMLLDTQIKTRADSAEEDLHNKIFLLSKEQAEHLLPTAEERIARPTEFATFGGAYRSEGKCCWWVLPWRGDGFGKLYPEAVQLEWVDYPDEFYPQAVLPNGELQYHSRNVAHRDWCVRPAIRIPTHILDRLPKGIDPAQKEEQEFRIPLDGENLYFLRLFLKDDRIDRASIDKEEANDSHYELSAEALKRLDFVLAGACGGGDLVQLLRKYFKNHSNFDLVRLMQQNGIPYKSFCF